MPYLTNLATVCRRSGLKVVEVGGWKTRGRAPMSSIKTITCHHTATPRKLRPKDDYPTMNVVKNGRTSIPGPLAQLGLGRSGTVYVIAAGRSNHAGKSKATSMTNSYAIGIEAEGAMEAWPRQQYDAYVRLVAALLTEWPHARVVGHKESASPAGRKNDPSFSMGKFRADVAAVGKKPAPKPAAPTAQQPVKKGILGMSGYEQYARVGDQIIKPGQKQRLRAHPPTKTHAGAHYIARPKRKGQKFLLQANIVCDSIPAGADVKAQLVIAIFRKGKPVEYLRPFEQVSIPAGVNGWSAIDLVQPEQLGSTPPAGASLEYQVEITNYSKADVKVRRVRSACFYE